MESIHADARRRSRRCALSGSPISSYVEQLERELRLKRAPRRRLLAETADHLRCSAEDIAAEERVGVSEAERRAVARFGEAAVVARRFAHVAASTSARSTLAWVVAAFAAYSVAAIAFVAAAPSWLIDFPQGAPSVLALQVSFVALALSVLRAHRFRTTPAPDGPRLRLVASGMLVSTLAVAAAAGAELVLALTRPAAAPWSEATHWILLFAVAAAVGVVAGAAAIATAARASALDALPGQRAAGTSPAAASLVDDVAAVIPALTAVAGYVVAHPARTCALLAGVTFVAVTGAGVVSAELTGQTSVVIGAGIPGLFETAAIVVAYLTLGRTLGIRPLPGARAISLE